MKRRQISARGTSQLRMVIAFIAGMAITAALAQTPVVADIFTPQVTHEPVAPTLPATPDSIKADDSHDTQPAKPGMSALVYAAIGEASPC